MAAGRNSAAAIDPFELVGTFMCPKCVGDPDIRDFIRSRLVANECTFCGRRRPRHALAADADEVVEHIAECLGSEYQDAVEEVMYDSAEGGYQADTLTSDELLFEVGFDPTNERAREYIARHLPDNAWVQHDFYRLTPYEAWLYSWRHFTDAVKHQTRYLFFAAGRPNTDEETIHPAHMLRALGNVIREYSLVSTLPAGHRIYRVREHGPGERPTTLDELGPPPDAKANLSNRMSPAGISMLYAAEDQKTALAETFDPKSPWQSHTVATLELTSDVPVVDLVALPANPSIFTPGTTREGRAKLNFVHAFARDVSRPISRDGREHIEYVPTQVVTEYLRHRFRYAKGKGVFGIRYNSAKLDGGVNLALFVSHGELLGQALRPARVGMKLARSRCFRRPVRAPKP